MIPILIIIVAIGAFTLGWLTGLLNYKLAFYKKD